MAYIYTGLYITTLADCYIIDDYYIMFYCSIIIDFDISLQNAIRANYDIFTERNISLNNCAFSNSIEFGFIRK